MLNHKSIELPFPKISDDYLDEHFKLLGKVEKIPFIATLNWWVVDFFVGRHDTDLYQDKSQQGKLESKTYSLTESEIGFINSGHLEEVLQSQIDDLVIHLYKYHLIFKYDKPSSIATTYAELLVYLRSVEPYEHGDRRNFKLEGKKLRLSNLRNLLLKNINELNRELEYRISELGFNIKDLLEELEEEDEELARELSLPIVGYHLVNPDKFENNLRSIYKLLSPKYLDVRNTSEEHIEQLFGLDKKYLIKPLIWVGNKDELNYFVRMLKAKGKITDKQVYRIAHRVFVSPTLETITNIANSHKKPTTSQKIDKIVELF